MLPSAALSCSKFKFIPGSWRQKLSPHTVQSLRPTEAGCCPESQCTAVTCLWKQCREDIYETGLARGPGKARGCWEEICFALPGLTANPVTTMAWPVSCCRGWEESCKSHIRTVRSREALKNWPDWGIQAICSERKRNQKSTWCAYRPGFQNGEQVGLHSPIPTL